MITDGDIKKLKTVFATKEDLHKLEKKFDGVVDVVVETRSEMRSLEDRLSKQAQENTQRILGVMDSFAGEIKNHRENEVFHNHKHDKIEERLVAIEEVSVATHELRKHAD